MLARRGVCATFRLGTGTTDRTRWLSAAAGPAPHPPGVPGKADSADAPARARAMPVLATTVFQFRCLGRCDRRALLFIAQQTARPVRARSDSGRIMAKMSVDPPQRPAN